MEVITAKMAKQLGLKRYFSGVPCKHGHVEERQVSNNTCLGCLVPKRELWKLQNKDKMAVYKKAHSKTEHAKEVNRLASARVREANPERRKIWAKNNPIAVRASRHKTKAKRKSVVGSASPKELKKLLEKQKFTCVYCPAKLQEKRHLDHIIPIARGGTNFIDNLQWLCPPCNLQKGSKDPIVFAQQKGII